MADFWGSEWPSVLIGVLPFAVMFLLLTILWRGLSCPECGTRAPWFVSPLTKTKRQWAEGGWRCATCGTDVDVRGRKVAPGTGPRPGWLVRSALLVVPPAVVGAVLLYVAVALIRQEPEPPLPPRLPRDAPAAAAPEQAPGQGLQ